ncbi:DUF6907 domain-containing protein [Actinacidiphila sp. ITFR-21]|uniref:DUF6907 domain-containing protein n=1 Tax=Actinacidiphila sp. ITFR-21 TaxID=3075199 RepID=UPI00288AD45F|nr:hypothetical protein [Streptomyces sp. ITFR-21]WNI15232.1 hypothetical protein RLT57_06565 [Streptomyces sp. ITFR-21]
MTYIPYRLVRTRHTLGHEVDMQCPAFCTQTHGTPVPGALLGTAEPGHFYDHEWHTGPSFQLVAPGDHYWDSADFCTEEDRVYPVLHTELSAEPLDDGTFGTPFIYVDTLNAGQGAWLDVAETDQLIRDLKIYTARLQELRDQLAELTEEES